METDRRISDFSDSVEFKWKVFCCSSNQRLSCKGLIYIYLIDLGRDVKLQLATLPVDLTVIIRHCWNIHQYLNESSFWFLINIKWNIMDRNNTSKMNIRCTNTLIRIIHANQHPYQAGHALQNGPHTHTFKLHKMIILSIILQLDLKETEN